MDTETVSREIVKLRRRLAEIEEQRAALPKDAFMNGLTYWTRSITCMLVSANYKAPFRTATRRSPKR